MCSSTLKGIENLLGVHNLVILDITYNNGSTFPVDETFGFIKSSTHSNRKQEMLTNVIFMFNGTVMIIRCYLRYRFG